MFSLYGGFICKTRRAGCVLTRVFLLKEEHFSKKWRGCLLVKIGAPQANFSTFYYNSLIQHYRKRKCIKCGSTPDDPAVCLVCGKFTCLQGNCCVDETGETRHYECIQVCHVTSNLVSATTLNYKINSLHHLLLKCVLCYRRRKRKREYNGVYSFKWTYTCPTPPLSQHYHLLLAYGKIVT